MHLAKKQNYSYFILLMWISFLVYLAYSDIKSFWLFLFLPPFFGLMLYIAVRRKHVALSMLLFLVFVSQAINPPFFFLNREMYLESPKWIMGNFNFNLLDFIYRYKEMYILILCIFLFSLKLNTIRIKQFPLIDKTLNSNKQTIPLQDTTEKIEKTGSKIRYSIYLILFVLVVATPLCLFMYNNGIGISTVEPRRLPFKLVGITFYTRMLFVPALIAYMYFKSNRSLLTVIVIMFYALLVGILSLSKGLVVMALIPVILFSYLDKKTLRLSLILLYTLILYLIVGEFRQVLLLTDSDPLEMLQAIFNLLSQSDLANQNIIVKFITAFSDRLFGAENTILAQNYNLPNNISEIIGFFAGNTNHISYIINFELFCMPEIYNLVVGTNIGFLNILLLLANKSLLLIFLLALVTSIFLSIIDWITKKYIYNNDYYKTAGYVLCFIMIFFLYDGAIVKFYIIVLTSLIGILLMKFLSKATNGIETLI